jgi:CrcB protein
VPYLSIAAIAVGGGLGSVARFLVAREMGHLLGSFLPYGTLVVNVLGSLALGWLATVFLDRPEINVALRLGIAVGFLGAFTTFSTFSFESVQLLLNGAVWRAALNVAVNTVVCLSMCYLGIQLARLG